MIIRCKKCGSTNIQVKYWVNPNTFKIDDVCSGEETECWCQDCEEYGKCEWIDDH